MTLSAPQSRNAISLEMRQDLLEYLRSASSDSACRAIVLTGADGNFCSGGQLKPPAGGANGPDPDRTRRNISVLHDIVRVLSAGSKPSLAAVEGYAYGAGLSLATACDLVIAAQDARFCASFAKIGLMADSGLLWSLPQRIGPARAREMMLSGRVVEADEAAQIGLASRLVPSGGARDAAIEAAGVFRTVAPLAVASMKRILAMGPGSLEEVLALEAEAQPQLTLSQDYDEGKRAFKERRQPEFRGA